MALNTSNVNRAGLPLLPHALGDVETRAILKLLPKAHAALAELKGVGERLMQGEKS